MKAEIINSKYITVTYHTLTHYNKEKLPAENIWDTKHSSIIGTFILALALKKDVTSKVGNRNKKQGDDKHHLRAINIHGIYLK